MQDVVAGSIGERIREARDRRGMSQAALTSRLGMARGQLSRLELGHRIPTTKVLVRIALAVDVTTDYLLGIDTLDPCDHRRERKIPILRCRDCGRERVSPHIFTNAEFGL